jgi:hypothetical protein
MDLAVGVPACVLLEALREVQQQQQQQHEQHQLALQQQKQQQEQWQTTIQAAAQQDLETAVQVGVQHAECFGTVLHVTELSFVTSFVLCCTVQCWPP